MSFIVVYVGIRIGNSTRRNDVAYLLHAERYGQYFFEPQEPGALGLLRAHVIVALVLEFDVLVKYLALRDTGYLFAEVFYLEVLGRQVVDAGGLLVERVDDCLGDVAHVDEWPPLRSAEDGEGTLGHGARGGVVCTRVP